MSEGNLNRTGLPSKRILYRQMGPKALNECLYHGRTKILLRYHFNSNFCPVYTGLPSVAGGIKQNNISNRFSCCKNVFFNRLRIKTDVQEQDRLHRCRGSIHYCALAWKDDRRIQNNALCHGPNPKCRLFLKIYQDLAAGVWGPVPS